MKYKIVILLIVVIILTLSIDRAVMKYAEKPCISTDVNTPVKSPCVTDNANGWIEDDKITYTTFSSPKADFTFEYPSTWVYEEQNLQNLNATGWNFYINQKKEIEAPILFVISPLTDWVDFCSKTSSNPPDTLIKVNSYKTNDPNTYVVYEQCGDIRIGFTGGYIYWQKGKRLSNASGIEDINKINLMNINLLGTESKKDIEIMQHVAQSIKIK